MNSQCIFCELRMLESMFDKYYIAETDRKALLIEFLHYFSSLPTGYTAPQATHDIAVTIKKFSGMDDLYSEEKKRSNDTMLSLYAGLKARIDNSPDPIDTALRIAIAGNIIDYGPANTFDIQSTLEKVLTSKIHIDDSVSLRKEIGRAKQLLYLGDNCGEIVADKLLLETIQHPNVYYAVRGEAILNDVTYHDAINTGIDKEANIISNGSNAPSTILDEVSDEFMDIFNKSDLIISKGQGNLEGLINTKEKNIYCLLVVKCSSIASLLNASKGDFVIKKI